MQKGFAQLLIIPLVIVALLVGAYYYKNINEKNFPKLPGSIVSEKTKSKNYENQNLGFTFEYESPLSVREDSEDEFNKRGNGNFRDNFKSYVSYEPGKVLGAFVVLEKEENFETNPLTIWVFDNPDDLTIDDWYRNYWYFPFVWGGFTYKGKFELAPKDEATISGQLGRSGVIDYQPGKPRFIYLTRDNKMYLFRVIGELGNQMLSSFKFLKSEAVNKGGCKIGGCSGQLCVEENERGFSTCEYRTEYGCYTNATCERQLNGRCDWTSTPELIQCLEQAKAKSQ